MIQSFADRDTEQLFNEERSRRFQSISRIALRKLIQMNRAGKLDDLAVPPGNRLEALSGNLAGLHSIRINQHEVQQHVDGLFNELAPKGLTESGALRAMKDRLPLDGTRPSGSRNLRLPSTYPI